MKDLIANSSAGVLWFWMMNYTEYILCITLYGINSAPKLIYYHDITPLRFKEDSHLGYPTRLKPWSIKLAVSNLSKMEPWMYALRIIIEDNQAGSGQTVNPSQLHCGVEGITIPYRYRIK